MSAPETPRVMGETMAIETIWNNMSAENKARLRILARGFNKSMGRKRIRPKTILRLMHLLIGHPSLESLWERMMLDLGALDNNRDSPDSHFIWHGPGTSGTMSNTATNTVTLSPP